MPKKSQNNANPKLVPSPYGWQTVLLSVLACFLLLIANSALWANNTFFNTKKFTQLTTNSMLSPSSRTALAGEVVDTALQGRPIAKRVIATPATKLVAGLLDTNLAEAALNKSVALLQTSLTTPRPQPVVVDLSGVKSVAEKLISLSDQQQTGEKIQGIPNQLTLFDATKLPNFYRIGQKLLLIGPLALIAGLLLLSYPHLKNRTYKYSSKVLYIQGGLLILTGFAAYSLGPVFRPTVLAQIDSYNLRIVVENVYNAFISDFDAQAARFFYLGGALVLVPALVWFYNSTVMSNIKQRFVKK